MGIVNVTPDSFSDGASYPSVDDAVKHAIQMVADGADLLDVGGESTRPGSEAVPADEEQRRVVPVIQRITHELPDTPVSVDTRKADVARAALDAGATVVNDISAGADPAMFEVVRDSGAGMILMHMKGEPKTMQEDPTYYDVVAEVRGFLGDRVEAAVAAGIDHEHLCVDPGIGFGKNLQHNLALLHDIGAFHHLEVAVLVGPSRKRFIGTLTGTEVDDRIEGTAGVVAWCAACGVDVVRVHDVKEMTRVVRVVDAIARASSAG
jgi:dihydropteroate synthase